MNFIKEKQYNLKNNHFLIVIFLFILIFSLICPVSASDLLDIDDSSSDTILQSNDDLKLDDSYKTENTLKSEESIEHEDNILSTNSEHLISSKLSNDEIQSIFDSSKSGDTVQFVDKEYSNISLIVDKKLNIVSTKNSILHTSDYISDKAKKMGIANSFGFYFTEMASGSVLKGLTITGNSDYEVMVEGADDIGIVNNNISGGNKAGILLKESNRSTIKNNHITKAYDGIVLNSVNRTKIGFNKIYSNKNIGIVLDDVFLNNVTNNSIYRNGLDGVLLKNAKNNRILNNNISNNGVSGLRLEGYTTRNFINYNNISSNVVNIYANSLTNGDQITQNTLMFAKRVYGTYVEDDNVGAGIVFADNYSSVKQGHMLFSHNSIGMNAIWDAKSTMSHPEVNIGANWYFDNDGEYGLGHICPMVFGRALDPEEFKHLSMGFGGDENGVFGQLFDGENPSGAGSFTIDNVNINGKDYGPIEVDENGRFNLDVDEENLEPGTVITITINGHSFNITVDELINNTKSKNSTKPATDVPTPQPSDKPREKDIVKEGTSSSTTGNGTGSGSGLSTGSGSGEGNFTGSGISVGTLSGQSNAGTGDSGENGGGSASEGISAYEILKEEKIPATAKNSQLLALFGVAFVILIIALGYRSKNKDDYQDDGDYSL